jgi:hypothetical protein
MKATIENLKANRNEIISVLVEMFGNENLKSKMTSLLNIVEEAELFKTHNTIEDCIDNLYEISQTSKRRTTKTAELLAKLEELNN